MGKWSAQVQIFNIKKYNKFLFRNNCLIVNKITLDEKSTESTLLCPKCNSNMRLWMDKVRKAYYLQSLNI